MERGTQTARKGYVSHNTASANGDGHCRERNEVSEEKFGRSQITVSNVAGYLCHISSEVFFPCSPRSIFPILSNPDNSSVFRDIKSLGYRKVIEEGTGGYRVVEVEQQGEVKIMWRTHKFSTFLTVTEDSRNESALTTTFSLIKSDVLSKFQGTWTLYPGPSEEGQESTRAILEQDVLPKGVPPFMTHMPLLGSILRGICVRAVRRLHEDIEGVLKQAHQEGVPVEEVLRIQSHAVMQMSDSEENGK